MRFVNHIGRAQALRALLPKRAALATRRRLPDHSGAPDRNARMSARQKGRGIIE